MLRIDGNCHHEESRQANLAALELLPSQLEVRNQDPALGSVKLVELLATWVAHDLDHLAQIARVMAKRYREAVGPWAQYLRILQ